MGRRRTGRIAVLGVIVAAGLATLSPVGVAGAGGVDPDPGAGDPVAGQAAPPSGTPAETAVTVGDETEYRNALSALSLDGAGPHTITLTADITLSVGTDPLYDGSQDLTLDGAGFAIDAAGTSKILDFDTTALLTVRNITMRNGVTGGAGGAVEGEGGIVIEDSVFEGNESGIAGGAVDAPGEVVVEDSVFEGNETFNDGGAIDGAGVTLLRSRFTRNLAGEDGGAVDTSDDGSLVAVDSTFEDNDADDEGAAVEAEEDVTLINSTFSGNGPSTETIKAESGDISLLYVTLADNATPAGTAVLDVDDGGTLTSFGTVIVTTGSQDACDTDISSVTSSFSYSTDASCGLNGTGDTQNGADPDLGALADNGGPTPTRLPATDSPLVDAIPTGDCDPTEPDDQRGVARPQDGGSDGTLGCDIGAVEVEGTTPPTPPSPPPPPGPVPAAPAFAG